MELLEVVRGVNIATSIIPIIILVFGFFVLKVIPRKPNWFMGFRTLLACKNQDTWVFAQRHFGRWIVVSCLILTAINIVGVILITHDIFTIEPVLLFAMTAVATFVAVTISAIRTQIVLRREFDKNGDRRR